MVGRVGIVILIGVVMLLNFVPIFLFNVIHHARNNIKAMEDSIKERGK
jgi:hypothetical protein